MHQIIELMRLWEVVWMFSKRFDKFDVSSHFTGPNIQFSQYNRASELSITNKPNCHEDLIKVVVTALRKNIDGFRMVCHFSNFHHI